MSCLSTPLLSAPSCRKCPGRMEQGVFPDGRALSLSFQTRSTSLATMHLSQHPWFNVAQSRRSERTMACCSASATWVPPGVVFTVVVVVVVVAKGKALDDERRLGGGRGRWSTEDLKRINVSRRVVFGESNDESTAQEAIWMLDLWESLLGLFGQASWTTTRWLRIAASLVFAGILARRAFPSTGWLFWLLGRRRRVLAIRGCLAPTQRRQERRIVRGRKGWWTSIVHHDLRSAQQFQQISRPAVHISFGAFDCAYGYCSYQRL
jgi:hypothetical protein